MTPLLLFLLACALVYLGTVEASFGALTFPADVVGATPATFTVCRLTPIGKQKRTVQIRTSGTASVTPVYNATTCP